LTQDLRLYFFKSFCRPYRGLSRRRYSFYTRGRVLATEERHSTSRWNA